MEKWSNIKNRKLKFFNTSKQLIESEIAAIEKDLSICLPRDFKHHYLEYNGGLPLKQKYKWPDNSYTRINTFFSIKHDDYNLEDTYKDIIHLEEYFTNRNFAFCQ